MFDSFKLIWNIPNINLGILVSNRKFSGIIIIIIIMELKPSYTFVDFVLGVNFSWLNLRKKQTVLSTSCLLGNLKNEINKVGVLICNFSGQLVVASLLSRKIKSRLLLRDPQKARTLFGKQDEELLQVNNKIFFCFLYL